MSAATATGATSGAARAIAAIGASALCAGVTTAYLALFGTPETARPLPHRPSGPVPPPGPAPGSSVLPAASRGGQRLPRLR